MRTLLRRTALAALALTAACSPTEPTRISRELGFLQLHESPIDVRVPSTVRAGEVFTVAVMTVGGGCSSHGDTEMTQSGATVDVRPFDLFRHDPGVACPDLLRTLPHYVSVRFDTPGTGTGTVRVHGRREPQGDIITVTRTVTVQPAG